MFTSLLQNGTRESRIPAPGRRSLLQAPKSYSTKRQEQEKDINVASTDDKHSTDGESVNGDDVMEIPLGSRMCIGGAKVGTLRYFGKCHIAEGYYCGIELDEPDGRHDGLIQGVRYFTCTDGYGIFAPLHKVTVVSLAEQEKPQKRRSGIPPPKTRPKSAESQKSHVSDESGETAIRGDSKYLEEKSEKPVSRIQQPKVQTWVDSGRLQSDQISAESKKIIPVKESKLPNKTLVNIRDSDFNNTFTLVEDPDVTCTKQRQHAGHELNRTFDASEEALILKARKSHIPMPKNKLLNTTFDKEDKNRTFDLQDVETTNSLPDTSIYESPISRISQASSESFDLSESLQFLKGSQLVSESSQHGLLSPSKLHETDLLPEFLAELEANQRELESQGIDVLQEATNTPKKQKKVRREQDANKSGIEEIYFPDEPFDGTMTGSVSGPEAEALFSTPTSMTDSRYGLHFKDVTIKNPKHQEKNLDEWELENSNSEESTTSEMTKSIESNTSMSRSIDSVNSMLRSGEAEMETIMEARESGTSLSSSADSEMAQSLEKSFQNTVKEHTMIESVDEGFVRSIQDSTITESKELKSKEVPSSASDYPVKKPTMEESLDEGMVKSSQEFDKHVAHGVPSNIIVYSADVPQSEKVLEPLLPENGMEDQLNYLSEGALTKMIKDESPGEKERREISDFETQEEQFKSTENTIDDGVKKERPVSGVSSTDTGFWESDISMSCVSSEDGYRRSLISEPDSEMQKDPDIEKQRRGARIIDGKLYNYEITEENVEGAIMELDIKETPNKTVIEDLSEKDDEDTSQESEEHISHPAAGKDKFPVSASQKQSIEPTKKEVANDAEKTRKSKSGKKNLEVKSKVSSRRESPAPKKKEVVAEIQKKPLKMPNRNVVSKIKAMLDASPPPKSKVDEPVKTKMASVQRSSSPKKKFDTKRATLETEVLRSPPDLSKVRSRVFEIPKTEPIKKIVKAPKKPNKWDLVAAKIAANLADEKTKPKKKTEVKSKLYTPTAASQQRVAAIEAKVNLRSRSLSPTKDQLIKPQRAKMRLSHALLDSSKFWSSESLSAKNQVGENSIDETPKTDRAEVAQEPDAEVNTTRDSQSDAENGKYQVRLK